MGRKLGWHEVFEELDPPPRGLEALRDRLDHREAASPPLDRASLSLRRVAIVAAVAVAFAVLGGGGTIWFGTSGSSDWSQEIADASNPALVRLGLRSPHTDLVSVPSVTAHRTVVEKVALDRPGVVYYRVITLDDGATTNQPGP